MSPIKTLAVIALSLAANHALAEWVESATYSDKNGAYTFYYDPIKTTAVSGSKNLKRALTMLSYEKKQTRGKGEPYLSVINRVEIDCKKEQYKIVAYHYYSKAMGMGDIVDTITVPSYRDDWGYPAPNTVLEVVIEHACSKS